MGIALIVVSLVLGSIAAVPAQIEEQRGSAAPAPDGRVKGFVPPPRNLRLVGDHWTAYDPPTPPEGAQVHTVVPGDSLWALSQQAFNDPYLWPTIWDANRWITYSHWIYPGDPIVIPGAPTVVGEAPPPAVVEPVGEPWTSAPPRAAAVSAAPAAPAAGPLRLPVASETEMRCAPQLAAGIDPTASRIFAREEPEKILQGQGDIVYIEGGTSRGMAPGQEFAVQREEWLVMHPATTKSQAHFVRNLGWLRVIAVQAESATAEIVTSCDAMLLGDRLIPARSFPLPVVEITRLDALSGVTDGKQGWVVTSFEPESIIAGEGHMIGIDLGSGAGLTVGDQVLFWRPGEHGAPRRVLGQGVVLQTGEAGSTVKLLETVVEIRVGDRAQAL
ncbi:MAG: LysM peptidoglycan-binding domain-containing protein [Acidobacteria bacterium]|nr:LysM peptidoglycan-binding domain-containing protein [Acidobacteriota bacterium]